MAIDRVYPNRLAGIPFLDNSGEITSGNIFWVNSATGDDGNTARDPRRPARTIDGCVAKCTASVGDVIYVMPGHTEAVTALSGINLDVAGITVIGLGNGTNRPLITMGTAVAASLNFGAANVTLKNMQFSSAINNLTAFINVNANDATIENCLFYTATTVEAYCFVNIVTTFDNTTIKGCTFRQPTDPAGTDAVAGTGAIFLVDSENVFVENCVFSGNFETAIFHNRTTACTNLIVKNCYGRQELSGAETFIFVAAATGGTLGGLFVVPASADLAEANVVGTESANFFYGGTTWGNDGAVGQQGGVMTAAS